MDTKSQFWDSFWRWLASSYGLAILPLFSRFITGQLITGESGSFQIEMSLFILVLGGSAVLEAYEDRSEPNSWRTMLLIAGAISALVGGISYGVLAAAAEAHDSTNFSGWWLIWAFLAVLSVSYFVYKVKVLRQRASGG